MHSHNVGPGLDLSPLFSADEYLKDINVMYRIFFTYEDAGGAPGGAE